jgi:hypothetical protein
MAVRYVRVKAIADMFAPAVRAFGNIAVVGPVGNAPPATTPAASVPTAFSNPVDAQATFPGPLGDSIAMTFNQSPGPSLVYGVRVNGGTPDWAAALAAVGTLDVQIVVLANTPVDATTASSTGQGGALTQLANHVTSVSNTGDDGKERIGVAMLESGSTNVGLVAGVLASERMVYIAHKSTQDAAAAVAGTIAGYEPHISLLLKPVSINTGLFTATEIDALNGSETFSSPPAGQGVNWLTDPVLIPGHGVYMGEGYTGQPGGKKFVDIVRTIDDVSFRLKAQLIYTIGSLRISRAGLRTLIAQVEAVLDPLVRGEVIEGYDIVVPILTLLDKDPAKLTASELQQINDAQTQRLVEMLVSVDYAGAIHRIALNLKFE